VPGLVYETIALKRTPENERIFLIAISMLLDEGFDVYGNLEFGHVEDKIQKLN
jgi:hypothetical protein